MLLYSVPCIVPRPVVLVAKMDFDLI